jgi:23S rRNA (adenine2503-C2)-methyltransferase
LSNPSDKTETRMNKQPEKRRADLLNMSLEEIKSDLVSLGEEHYRGDQIYQWVYRDVAFDEMTNLSKSLRQKLAQNYIIGTLKQLKRLISADEHTIKYLYLLSDNNIIECVVMKYRHGNTICLSTQVGCAMGCSFCASATGGLIRQLNAGEMMAQVLESNRDLAKLGWNPVSNVVLMGSGEPLDNYENTMKFIHQIHHPKGYNMSYRNITLSTCGLVPKMRALADEGLNINLAVSLHASNDNVRKKIMKVANVYSIEEIIDASRYFYAKTGRRITFEYVMIDGVNDRPELAAELSQLLYGFPNHVNLIPLNENKQNKKKRSNNTAIREFMSVLRSYGINVTIRREMGSDIQGACGQLKADFMEKL